MERRIPAWIEILERALTMARAGLEAMGLQVDPGELIRQALAVLEAPVKPLVDRLKAALADYLVKANVVYPKRARGGIKYLPQYPVYRVILEEAAKRGVSSLLDLDPSGVFRRAVMGSSS